MKLPILINLPADEHQLRLRLTELFKDINQQVNLLTDMLGSTGTADDIIIDAGTSGLVLKDTQATPHYWRVTVSNAGALVITDVGTAKP